ncbi:MAG: hypothetical protein ACP5E5_13745 [Acidobacteriaceae bacterium]
MGKGREAAAMLYRRPGLGQGVRGEARRKCAAEAVVMVAAIARAVGSAGASAGVEQISLSLRTTGVWANCGGG